ncbi:hypothetical protein QYE76_055196 [Lolium multiflorum]|uniref:Uncharacterized protein n=1 Tax=Lolium multiflorum TaxID=4521 RepID=A0AAD8SZY2_LOLMU|nr:hypothetical protein QYE76_055196 [Lolium multiflorum]
MAAEDLAGRDPKSPTKTQSEKKLGLMKKDDAIRFPSEESYPNPPMEYRVSFVDHLIRGLSAPIHDFLRGLLFVYGIQLHQTILLCLLFLPFLRMEKSKNKLSLPRTIKVPLFMKVKSRFSQICDFREKEVESAIDAISSSCCFEKQKEKGCRSLRHLQTRGN